MTKTEFINLISFCILMENNEGIVGKHPSYVLEKWRSKHPGLLDNDNTEKLNHYRSRWGESMGGLED